MTAQENRLAVATSTEDPLSSERAVLISRYPPRGKTDHGRGIAGYSKRLAEALAAHDVRVEVLADIGDDGRTVYVENGVTVRRVWRNGSRAIIDIMRAVDRPRSRKVVYHLQHELFAFGPGLSALVPPILLARLRRSGSVVTTIHGLIPKEELSTEFSAAYSRLPVRLVRAAYAGIVRTLPRLSDGIIVHARATRSVLDSYSIENRATVIPHGIAETATRMTREEGLRLLGLPDVPRAVFFGFLLPYKGLDDLVAAAPLLRDNGIEVLVAGGPHGDSKPTARGKAPVSSEVRYLGYIQEDLIPAIYGIADVIVLPYRVALSSSGPLALATSFGTPVVISDVPTLTECLPVPEAVFRRGDVKDLVATVCRVIGDRALQERIRRSMLAMADENSMSNAAMRTIEVYRRVLDGPRR